MTLTLTITRGAPASGKSTYAKDWVTCCNDGEKRARVNRDDLRASLFFGGGVLSHAQEGVITTVQQSTVKALLASGHSVICDDMNLTLKFARAWADLAQQEGVGFEVVDFTDVPLDELISRDDARAIRGQRYVGEQVIRGIWDRFHLGSRKPLPQVLPSAPKDGAATPSWRKYIPDENLRPAWIVDVDGTLAHNDGHRGWFEWAKVGGDTVIDPVRQIVRGLSAWGFDIVIMSGREDVCRQETHDWLVQNDVPFDDLHMRAAGDGRADDIVKHELFWTKVAPKYAVQGSIDDRLAVTKMWRDGLGLTVAQMAWGQF